MNNPKYFGWLLLITVLVAGCRKEGPVPEDNRCANLITDNKNIQLLSDQNMDTIRYIFQKNQIGYDNLQFWHYAEDLGFRYIGAYQFVNNLKVFTDYWGFEFDKKDSLLFLSGDSITNFTLSDKPRLNMAQVRFIFVQAIKSDEWNKNNSEIQDSCIGMEFGYYNLNSGSGNTANNYTTAWYVHPSDQTYPIAFIDDIMGKLITYSNGIIVNKK